MYARIDIEHQGILTIGLSMVLSTFLVEKIAKLCLFKQFGLEIVVHLMDSLP
jgi:hypothetical protein